MSVEVTQSQRNNIRFPCYNNLAPSGARLFLGFFEVLGLCFSRFIVIIVSNRMILNENDKIELNLNRLSTLAPTEIWK